MLSRFVYFNLNGAGWQAFLVMVAVEGAMKERAPPTAGIGTDAMYRAPTTLRGLRPAISNPFAMRDWGAAATIYQPVVTIRAFSMPRWWLLLKPIQLVETFVVSSSSLSWITPLTFISTGTGKTLSLITGEV